MNAYRQESRLITVTARCGDPACVWAGPDTADVSEMAAACLAHAATGHEVKLREHRETVYRLAPNPVTAEPSVYLPLPDGQPSPAWQASQPRFVPAADLPAEPLVPLPEPIGGTA